MLSCFLAVTLAVRFVIECFPVHTLPSDGTLRLSVPFPSSKRACLRHRRENVDCLGTSVPGMRQLLAVPLVLRQLGYDEHLHA